MKLEQVNVYISPEGEWEPKVLTPNVTTPDADGFTDLTFDEVPNFTLSVKGDCEINLGLNEEDILNISGKLSLLNSNLNCRIFHNANNTVITDSTISVLCGEFIGTTIDNCDFNGDDYSLTDSSMSCLTLHCGMVTVANSKVSDSSFELAMFESVNCLVNKCSVKSEEPGSLSLIARGVLENLSFYWDEGGKGHYLIATDWPLNKIILTEKLYPIYKTNNHDEGPWQDKKMSLHRLLINGKICNFSNISEIISSLVTEE